MIQKKVPRNCFLIGTKPLPQLIVRGPVTPYGDIDLGQHWFGVMAGCLTGQANVDIISNVQFHSYAVNFPRDTQPLIIKISLKNYRLKFHSNCPGANELINGDEQSTEN